MDLVAREGLYFTLQCSLACRVAHCRVFCQLFLASHCCRVSLQYSFALVLCDGVLCKTSRSVSTSAVDEHDDDDSNALCLLAHS